MKTYPYQDGGPAFPFTKEMETISGLQFSTGMTLRDYFAGQALNGYLASWSDDSDPSFFEPYHVAKTSYAYADAMLKVREVAP